MNKLLSKKVSVISQQKIISRKFKFGYLFLINTFKNLNFFDNCREIVFVT